MMSLTKFQLCLNHENPNIVKTGLIEFSNQVLKDHDAIDSFGYNGRTYSNITQDLLHQVCVFTPVKGILQSYIQSSPRLDDLFILWQLSGRDDDDSLCIAHTRCISVLLFCTGSIPHLQKLIAMKLMNEYVSSIMIQLSKGSIELRKVSVGLLLGILRIKNEEMTNRVLDLILSDPTLFKDQIQSSTASNLKQVQESASTEDFQTSTDIRFMLLILFLTALSSANEAILSLMLAEDSPFLILLEPILSDHASVTHLQLAIEGLMLVSATNKTLQNNLFQVQIMNKISVTKWLELFNHTDHSIRELIGCFIEAVGSSITDLFLSREKSVSTSKGDVNTRKVKPLFAIAKDVSVSLLDLIDPLTFTEHEKVQIYYYIIVFVYKILTYIYVTVD